MPNLASRNQSGTWYVLSESAVGEKGPLVMGGRPDCGSAATDCAAAIQMGAPNKVRRLILGMSTPRASRGATSTKRLRFQIAGSNSNSGRSDARFAKRSVLDEIRNRHQHHTDDDERDDIGNEVRKDHEQNATHQRH